MSTPSFISDATTRSLAAGETFYTPNRGIPAFREAIARYMSTLYETTFSPDRFLCTIGGMHAMQIAMRLALSKGDELLVPSPAWPNFNGAAMAIGAVPVDVPMGLTGENQKGRWFLDLDRLAQAVTPKTKAIVINSPSNPTGWTATLQELRMSCRLRVVMVFGSSLMKFMLNLFLAGQSVRLLFTMLWMMMIEFYSFKHFQKIGQ